MTIATLTTDMYILSRSHERKVLSLAQWSRASEDSLGKSKGAKIGRERNRWEVEELSRIRMALLRQDISSLVYDDSLSAQRLEYLSHGRHGRRPLQLWCWDDISLGGVPHTAYGSDRGEVVEVYRTLQAPWHCPTAPEITQK